VIRMRSLRHQLAFTYAGIALLTTVLLGGILLLVLSDYYAEAEAAYLRAASERIVAEQPESTDAEHLRQWAQLQALATQTRVRVLDGEGTVMADSGSPRDLDAGQLLGQNGVPTGERPPRGPGRLPRPLGGGIFGNDDDSDDDSVSNRSLRFEVTIPAGPELTMELSEAPTSGQDVLGGVAQAWLLSAALAVVLAALAGYLLSRRISQPLVELTAASDRMAEGDLDARADIDREDEVGRLAESFNSMADRMQITVTELRRFVADAAHQIGTPLTALQADLELAQADARTDDERRLVDRALVQARRLEELSANLLTLSRIEAGESGGALARINLTELASEAADTLASRAEQADLTLATDIAPGPIWVLAEKAKLQVVVDSLLDNAVKFTPAGGTISLGLSEDGTDAVITVIDTGVGIPLAEQDAVFERFHRARNVASFPGSGLGLAIVRATVVRLGGSVSFASDESGTRFEVRLPKAESRTA
jgi:signal transduction histidine kinase